VVFAFVVGIGGFDGFEQVLVGIDSKNPNLDRVDYNFSDKLWNFVMDKVISVSLRDFKRENCETG
jgi:hypothetical protein